MNERRMGEHLHHPDPLDAISAVEGKTTVRYHKAVGTKVRGRWRYLLFDDPDLAGIHYRTLQSNKKNPRIKDLLESEKYRDTQDSKQTHGVTDGFTH